MTTQEAYKLAARLRGQGVPYRDIAKELAKNGYVSWRTGKKVTCGGAYTMVKAVREGHIPKNKQSRKSRAYLYAPRPGKQMTPAATIQRAITNAPTPAPTQAATTHISQFLNIPQRTAMDTLQNHARVLRNVADAIDTLLAAIR
jgi:hypothetical protein